MNVEDQVCLLRVTEKDRRALEQLIFKRYPNEEWGTFFRFGYRITPWGIHATFVDLIEPYGDDLDPASSIVEFKAAYILRAQLNLTNCPLGIGVIHSHPEGGGTGASSLDNDMDDYFAREFSLYGGFRPYLSLRMSRAPDRTFRFSGEAWHDGDLMPVTQIATVGTELTREYAERCSLADEAIVGASLSCTTRLVDLIGDNATRLQRAAVAVIGCGGLGSPAIHVLVRSGIRRFVLVDPDVFEPSNLERLHGSTRADVGESAYKVDILRRLIVSIAPDAEVHTVVGNVLDDSVLDEILRCDIVLGCTDTQHSRAALGDYATHYLLPCIDGAVLMRMRNGALIEQVGEIARYSGEDPCPWCMGRIDQQTLAYELMSESERQTRADAAAQAIDRGVDGAQYWGDRPPAELTVGYMTTVVGAMQAGYAETWLAGIATMPHHRFQFDLGMPFLAVAPDPRSRRPECACNRTKGWADQARDERSVTKPSHWPNETKRSSATISATPSTVPKKVSFFQSIWRCLTNLRRKAVSL